MASGHARERQPLRRTRSKQRIVPIILCACLLENRLPAFSCPRLLRHNHGCGRTSRIESDGLQFLSLRLRPKAALGCRRSKAEYSRPRRSTLRFVAPAAQADDAPMGFPECRDYLSPPLTSHSPPRFPMMWFSRQSVPSADTPPNLKCSVRSGNAQNLHIFDTLQSPDRAFLRSPFADQRKTTGNRHGNWNSRTEKRIELRCIHPGNNPLSRHHGYCASTWEPF